ncbi:hypothetical protein [Nocardioides sp.]|uniref:hypothetical protein n=1 Tax=Nocardioides sp. TaxID=35761 RepID=UPI00356487CF
MQFEHAQFAHESLQEPHSQTLWLHVGHVQFAQSHVAQASLQSAHEQVTHSS